MFGLLGAVTLLHAFETELFEINIRRLPAGDFVMRQKHLIKFNFHIAALGDLKRLPHRFRTMFEEGVHFFRRLVVKLMLIKAHPVGFHQRGSGPDA